MQCLNYNQPIYQLKERIMANLFMNRTRRVRVIKNIEEQSEAIRKESVKVGAKGASLNQIEQDFENQLRKEVESTPAFVKMEFKNNEDVAELQDQESIFLVKQIQQKSKIGQNSIFKKYQPEPTDLLPKTKHAQNLIVIPFRKCQTSIQQKIVIIINKIKNNKNYHRDVETLISKMSKISRKDLTNKFFVSGVKVIMKLLNNEGDFQTGIKLEEAMERLKNVIHKYLDDVDEYITRRESKLSRQSIPLQKMIRKVYKILLKNHKNSRSCQVLQQAAIQKSRSIFNDQNFTISQFISTCCHST